MQQIVNVMHRQPVLSILDLYERIHPDEHRMIARIRALVQNHADCFLRTCLPGHITGSAWVVSPDRRRFLLTHHRKLGKWLQLGGHADGETAPHRVALREAREESGLIDFTFVETAGAILPLDVDVHFIPARKSEPAHEHHDLRYLLIASDETELRTSNESHDVRWFTRDELLDVTSEESMLRMLRKTEQISESAKSKANVALS